MMLGKSVLERAFDMASSGHFGTTVEIQHALQREGYTGGFIKGPGLLRQLRAIMTAARRRHVLPRGMRLEHEMSAAAEREYTMARRPLLSEMDAAILRELGFTFKVFDAAQSKFELETPFTVSPGPSPHTWTFRQADLSDTKPTASATTN